MEAIDRRGEVAEQVVVEDEAREGPEPRDCRRELLDLVAYEAQLLEREEEEGLRELLQLVASKGDLCDVAHETDGGRNRGELVRDEVDCLHLLEQFELVGELREVVLLQEQRTKVNKLPDLIWNRLYFVVEHYENK